MTHAPPLVTTWLSGGVEWEVSTAHLPEESEQEWRLRHAEAVRVMKALHPPD